MDLKLFLKDREEIIKDAKRKKKDFKIIKKILNLDKPIVADFTEYNPLHKGHKYCLDKGKEKGIFISVLPGPLERSGRGVPYFIDRYVRAELAIKAGADLVVEGPAMGILGSGQYMRCLIKQFYFLNAQIIPRGYIPENTMDRIIELIKEGYHIGVKPYKIYCIETGEILGEKLEIDNYVIASMSQTLYKLKKEGINYNPKFLFVKRLEGISGTKIRELIKRGKFEEAKKYLPETTIKILEEKYKKGELKFLHRFEDRILETVNNYDLYKYLPEKVAQILEKNRPYESIDEINIPFGFSRHFKERVLSILEARIERDIIKKYVDNYPSKIKILGISDKLKELL